MNFEFSLRFSASSASQRFTVRGTAENARKRRETQRSIKRSGKNDTMTTPTTFTFRGTTMTVNRMGYGAMQLAGPGVFGPPSDVDAALAVLREAVNSGVNHIDTSDYYGPHVTNQIIKQALRPYPKGPVIATNLAARRGDDKSW